MSMQVVREIFEEVANTPWVIRENRDIEEAGFVDESALEIWINPDRRHPTKTFIHECIHIIRPLWDEDMVEKTTQDIWANSSNTIKGVLEDWYIWLFIKQKEGS